MGKKLPAGFTALELMITMTLVAILMVTAVPAIKNYSWNLRIKTAVDVLRSDLNFARRRSIGLNSHTVVCPANAASTCLDSPSWKNGWIIFADLNADQQRQSTEPLLKQSSPVEFLTINSSRKWLRFLPGGTAAGSNASIVFCDQRGAQYAAKIFVSNSGRIRVESRNVKATENCP